MDGTNMFFIPLIIVFALFGFLLVIGTFVFWILMLIDVLRRNFKNPADKIAWVLVIIFTHIVGALIYYFLVKKTHKPHKKSK